MKNKLLALTFSVAVLSPLVLTYSLVVLSPFDSAVEIKNTLPLAENDSHVTLYFSEFVEKEVSTS